jgi:hypothetical protein
VQNENGKHSNSKQTDQRQSDGRVVSMRAWKTKKRIQYVRGNRNWGRYVFSLVGWFCAIVTAACAVLSCVPFTGQVSAIVFAWFVGTIGCSVGLALHVWRDRTAKKVLTLCTCALALSFVAALAKYLTMTR